MHTEDLDLVERARRGDEAAFDALCRHHDAAVRRHVHGRLPLRLRRRLSAADVVQETFATAFARLRELDEPFQGSFRAWLLKIAEFKAKEIVRFHLDTAKRALRAEVSSANRPDTAALRIFPGTPSREAVQAESKAAIDEHIAALQDSYRTILELVYAGGLAIAEAARRMGITPEAARQVHARAIAALARRIQTEEGTGDGRV